MSDVFGQHRPKIPYRPVADLLAAYRERDPGKLAIVDLDQDTSISFGELDRAVADIAGPLNIELNATLIADLSRAVAPALTLVHKELDGGALLAGKPFVRFGSYRAA